MELSDTPLAAELELINQSDTGTRYFIYEATITTEQEADIPVLKVVSIDRIRDYRFAVTDESIIDIAMAAGTYLKRVLPFKENLKLTLTKTPVGTFTEDNPRVITVQEYTALLLNVADKDSLGDKPATANEDAANLVDMTRVSLQIQETIYEQVRTEMVGGVFKKQTPFEVLKTLLYQAVANWESDVEESIIAVDLVDAANTAKREHIIVDHGTMLVELADRLQVHLGGIYNAGIGFYLQRDKWYVWPLYDNTRYDEVENTATFIILPDPRMRGTERTYRKTDRHFVAIITGGVSKQDASEGALLNQGNSVRFPDTNKLMEGFVETKDNVSVAKRTNNANEYKAINRRGESNMSRVSSATAYTNAFHEASKLAERNAAYLVLNWENSDPDLITPGLQCEVGFTSRGEPVYINGVVVFSHPYSALSGTGLHQQVHQITTQVVVMVNRNSPEYQAWLDTQAGGATPQ